MKQQSPAWHARQLKHAQDCIALADKVHTPEELAAARAALDVKPVDVQSPLFEQEAVES